MTKQYKTQDGQHLTVETFRTSGSVRSNDKRTLYWIAGRRVVKAIGAAALASATEA